MQQYFQVALHNHLLRASWVGAIWVLFLWVDDVQADFS